MNNCLLYNLLADSVKLHSTRKVVVENNNSLTYADLMLRSEQLSSSLIEKGVEVGDRVGLMLDKSVESIISLFGILKAGAVYVPIDPLSPVNTLEHIINNCKIRILITSGRHALNKVLYLNNNSYLNILIIAGDRDLSKHNLYDFEIYPFEINDQSVHNGENRQNISDNSPAYILHTSGSTGAPKGVTISHKNALTFINMAADFFNISTEDQLASHAPLHFDLSVFDIFVAISKGATIVLVPDGLSIFPSKLAQFISDANITVWNSVASVLSLLANRGNIKGSSFKSLRLVIFSGDILPVKHLRILKRHFHNAQFFNVYGQTEANSSTCYLVDDIPSGDDWKIPIGKPFPNFDVFALDESNAAITACGAIGELYIASPTVALGYWRDPSKTEVAFVPDPRVQTPIRKVYRTGDLVRIDINGDYVFEGRKDRQIKSRGYRVQLDEIENILKDHPGIKEAAVIAVPDELIGYRIRAYISPLEGRELIEKDIFEHCNLQLPHYKIPEAINLMDNLPHTATGKLNRKMLEQSAAVVDGIPTAQPSSALSTTIRTGHSG